MNILSQKKKKKKGKLSKLGNNEILQYSTRYWMRSDVQAIKLWSIHIYMLDKEKRNRRDRDFVIHTCSACRNSCSISPKDFLSFWSMLQYCKILPSTISSSWTGPEINTKENWYGIYMYCQSIWRIDSGILLCGYIHDLKSNIPQNCYKPTYVWWNRM